MTDHDEDDVHPSPVDQNDERLWKTAETAFLERYTRSTDLRPEKVAKWAVEGAVALSKEFKERKEDEP